MKIYTMLTDDTASLFLDGKMHNVPRSNQLFDEIRRAEADEPGALDRLRQLLDPVGRAQAALTGSGVDIRNGQVWYRGERLNSVLEKRLLDVAVNGLDVEAWKLFVKRLYMNPSATSREELYLFLERGNLPLTPDGYFLAFKRVREDYTDCHTGTFDNSVGQIVEMPRHEVDDNRYRTCSSGLHFCSKEYLRSFLSGAGRIMAVKIDPADVVSIPSDYNNTKGRTWRYEVVDEMDTSDEESMKEWGIVVDTYTPDDFEWDDWDDEFDDYVYDDEDDDFDEESEVAEFLENQTGYRVGYKPDEGPKVGKPGIFSRIRSWTKGI